MAPLRAVEKFTELSSEEVKDLFLVVQKVQKVNEDVHNANSSSIVIQDGQEAGQTVKVIVIYSRCQLDWHNGSHAFKENRRLSVLG